VSSRLDVSDDTAGPDERVEEAEEEEWEAAEAEIGKEELSNRLDNSNKRRRRLGSIQNGRKRDRRVDLGEAKRRREAGGPQEKWMTIGGRDTVGPCSTSCRYHPLRQGFGR
jgi:hypothetical protein